MDRTIKEIQKIKTTPLQPSPEGGGGGEDCNLNGGFLPSKLTIRFFIIII